MKIRRVHSFLVPMLLAGLGLMLATTAPAQIFTNLYTFPYSPQPPYGFRDGATPYAGLVQGRDGFFYGTTSSGGPIDPGYGSQLGTVFKISANGALTTLYSFTGGNDGAQPYAALVQGSDGNFYGTTYAGGTNNLGTVFKISANGALTSLYSFTGTNDGSNPYFGALAQGSDGNFYGTTTYGGTNNLGAIFKISTNGVLASLYSFTGTNDGASPWAGLLQGSDGNFYGTTRYGGTNNWGTVFKISTNGALTSLYFFTGTNDGANPVAGLAQGSNGNFYGTTTYGGTNNSGTVFRISANGALTSLYSFSFNDGAEPYAALVQGSDGNFYGTTVIGGNTNYYYAGLGTVFKIDTNGVLTSLYAFTAQYDGAYPVAGLVQGHDGNFYGTTTGIAPNVGNVFRLAIVPEPPELNMIHYGANVILTWPANLTEGFNVTPFILEVANNLASPAVWQTNSAPTIVIGGQNVVINPITGAQMFFRLFSQPNQ